MKRISTIISAIILLIALMPAGKALATKHVINVQNYSFSPASINNVVVGDTMRWVWVSGTHTTTSTTIPAGAAPWNSQIKSTLTSFEYKVTLAGTYNYECTPHAAMGMVGSFVATAPAPTIAVTPQNQNVSYTAGSTNFNVTSNSDWTVSSDQSWCTPTASGSGNGSIAAAYSANPTSVQRVATLTINVSGLAPTNVTVTQTGSSLSVRETKASSFRIYPNPAQDVVNISFESNAPKSGSISLLNAIGKEVHNQKISGLESYSIESGNLARGSYFIRIITPEGTKVSKLVLVE